MADRSDEPLFSDFTVVIDTREQAAFSFTGHRATAKKKHRPLVVQTVIATLKTGDYSLVGFEDRITIERKSLADAYATFSHERERFERELLRMAKYENAHVVVEADWPMVLSRRCPDCCGLGKIVSGNRDAEITVRFFKENIRRILYMDMAAVLKMLNVVEGEPMCERCGGLGQLHAMDHTKFSPKSFYRGVMAWKIRFPNVQWEFCYSRAFAEKTTLALLERFWDDEQDRLKRKRKGESL